MVFNSLFEQIFPLPNINTMIKGFVFSFGIFMLLVFSSCIGQYGNNITQSSHPLANDSCTSLAENVFLFFDGEPIHFDYTKRSLVEVMGNENSTDTELLNRLKYQAYSNCANAVVNIRWTWVQRETGTYGDPKSRYTYNAKVYTGLAVKINSDELYKSNALGNYHDVTYQEQMKLYQKREGDEVAMKVVVYLLSIGFCIAYAIAKSAK